MRNLKYIFIFLLFSCGQEYPAQVHVPDAEFDVKLSGLLDHSVREISVGDLIAYQYLYTLIDAREIKEYNTSHIQDALFVGYENFDGSVLEKTPKDEALIVYCSVGYRSEKIAERLIENGFTNVRNLYGGIFEWKNRGMPVVNENGETEKVHTYNKSWSKWLKKGEKVY